MIAVDTNILVYAHRSDLKFHSSAFQILRELAESEQVWYIPWPCIHEFYAIVTNPRIFRSGDATKPEQALAQIHAWEESPYLEILAEQDGYLDYFAAIIEKSKVKGALVHDARVYALCEFHRVKTLYSADRDFSNFSGSLHVRNPL